MTPPQASHNRCYSCYISQRQFGGQELRSKRDSVKSSKVWSQCPDLHKENYTDVRKQTLPYPCNVAWLEWDLQRDLCRTISAGRWKENAVFRIKAKGWGRERTERGQNLHHSYNHNILETWRDFRLFWGDQLTFSGKRPRLFISYWNQTLLFMP